MTDDLEPMRLRRALEALGAAVAALAASAAVAALTVGGLGSGGGSNGAAPADARLVSFPEGSALHLLLTSTPEGDRP
jgi:hypothetical protein